ncbi:hypothetical protein PAXINDRAFT_14099 [Paxillus involutus ATCC 200175]|uniref:PRP1 splicing factor N-terminal domain-containing protein n=1 Tax=Paxillus involutus ATCC 200175 TaxID=664439 RepID=A0A0C9TRJ8_PAXIN|nr:hypothetical protein PAXINDRAFT_14099 [Paxillus involutus ATCC 200175]
MAFLSMPAPASASGFTTRSDIGPAREGPSAEAVAPLLIDREAQARRGEEPEVDPDQFQDPDNEYGRFAGTTYEQDDEEADKIYDAVDQSMDSRRRACSRVRARRLLSRHLWTCENDMKVGEWDDGAYDGHIHADDHHGLGY